MKTPRIRKVDLRDAPPEGRRIAEKRADLAAKIAADALPEGPMLHRTIYMMGLLDGYEVSQGELRNLRSKLARLLKE